MKNVRTTVYILFILVAAGRKVDAEVQSARRRLTFNAERSLAFMNNA